MSKKRIFTIGFELQGDSFEVYNGKALLSERSSFKTKESLNHWHSEIVVAVNAGKLVIIYLIKPEECFRYTGEKQYSGTGRSRVTTTLVTEISSYQSVPKLKSVFAKSGENIRIDNSAVYIAPYWKEFSAFSPYQVQIEGDFTHVLLKSRSGDRIVGAAFHGKSGVLLFLPPLCYDKDQFVRYDDDTEKFYWTKTALEFEAKLVTSLANLADTLRKSIQATPPPPWTGESKYQLDEETKLEKQISTLSTKMAKLQEKKTILERNLQDACSLRWLLYEYGRLLENALLEALVLFGFEATPFEDGVSEFDAVFISPEGRCLGEVEGKDNKAININKMSQLERNLQEDFARDEVDEFAKGVLFGNAYRLTPIDKRGDFFTKKCISAAIRGRITLVRTPDLFFPAKYLKQNPGDDEYAKQCRKAIFSTEGTEVIFPSPPIQEEDIIITDDSGGQ